MLHPFRRIVISMNTFRYIPIRINPLRLFQPIISARTENDPSGLFFIENAVPYGFLSFCYWKNIVTQKRKQDGRMTSSI